jgi:hypothetical protein
MERTISAAVKVSLDSNGNLEVNRPNAIFTSSAVVLDGNKVRMKWFYCPLVQKSVPACFRIYYDNGSGQIDYENSIAENEYIKRSDYEFISQSLDSKTYLFAIRVINEDGDKNLSTKQIKVQIKDNSPPSVEIVDITNS